MITQSILKQAKALIDHPSKWTTIVGARDSNGQQVKITDPTATCWCVIGAIGKVMSTPYPREMLMVQNLHQYKGISLDLYNDLHGRTHAEIMEMFDDLIERAPQ